jgi:hypothetical protein
MELNDWVETMDGMWNGNGRVSDGFRKRQYKVYTAYQDRRDDCTSKIVAYHFN